MERAASAAPAQITFDFEVKVYVDISGVQFPHSFR